MPLPQLLLPKKSSGKEAFLQNPDCIFQTQIRDRTSFLVLNRSFGIFRRLSDHVGPRHHDIVSVCPTVSVSK